MEEQRDGGMMEGMEGRTEGWMEQRDGWKEGWTGRLMGSWNKYLHILHYNRHNTPGFPATASGPGLEKPLTGTNLAFSASQPPPHPRHRILPFPSVSPPAQPHPPPFPLHPHRPLADQSQIANSKLPSPPRLTLRD